MSTFYRYFIRNKDQRPKVCKLNPTVNIKEKLKVTRAPQASVTPEPQCFRIIQQPAKLAKPVFSRRTVHGGRLLLCTEGLENVSTFKGNKGSRTDASSEGWMVQSQWSRFVLNWDSWMGHECKHLGEVEDMIPDSPEWL